MWYNWYDIGGYANWSNFSDGRFKETVREDIPGLAFTQALRPVTYTEKSAALSNFLAQEVEQVAKQLNDTFSGVIVSEDTSKDHYALRYAEFVVPLIKAVQEQHEIIEQYEEKWTTYRTDLQSWKRP